MTTTVFCPLCGVARPLVEFRRWASTRGAEGAGVQIRRVLHDVCNVCAPPQKPPSKEERLMKKIIDGRRTTTHIERSRTTAERTNSRRRRKAWADQLLKPLRAEREWAMRNAVSAQRLQEKEARGAALERDPNANPNDEDASAKYGQWAEFFQVYVQVLREMERDIQQTLARHDKPGNPIKPGEAHNAPSKFIDPTTLASLSRIYSKCVPVRGRRLYRDPVFLNWRDVT